MADEELSAEETAAAEKAAEKAAAAEEAAATESAAEKAAAEEAAAKKKDEPVDWRTLLTSDDAKKQAERFESLDAVLQANADFRKQISDRIKLPGKDADEKEVAKFRKAMGIPDKPEDYKIALPDGVELDEGEKALLDAVRPIAHEANVPDSVLSAFLVGFKELETQIVNEAEAQAVKHRDATKAELRKEWGGDYEPNITIANRAMVQFGGEDLTTFLNDTEMKDGGTLANDPQIVRLFAKLGRQMSEDGMMLPMDKDEAVDVEAKIDDLTQKAMVALETGNRVLADKLYAERSALSSRLYGDEPIGGVAA